MGERKRDSVCRERCRMGGDGGGSATKHRATKITLCRGRETDSDSDSRVGVRARGRGRGRGRGRTSGAVEGRAGELSGTREPTPESQPHQSILRVQGHRPNNYTLTN